MEIADTFYLGIHKECIFDFPFQFCINKIHTVVVADNNGNILLSIVAHNYGQPMVDLILDSTYGDSENVKLQYDNISWLEDMQYAHNNPNVYLDNWLESSYGDGEYLKHVLRYCPTNLVKYKHNNKEYCFDLIGLKIISVQELNLGSKVM